MNTTNGTILLAHGGGGQLTDELIQQSILPRLGNPILSRLLDAGLIESGAGMRLALTIDSYVVQPWNFPGGDIGRLAVCGTVNDISVCGSKPLGIALSLILPEGLPRHDLERVLDSVREASGEADVPVITGDTKVVDHAAADSILITTSGVGQTPDVPLSPERVQPGDVLLINGPIADHGIAVMLAREMPEVNSVLRSDAAPLNGLIHSLVQKVGEDVVFMRDPTRGGVAGVVHDLAQQSGWHIELDEAELPVRPETRHTADMLGLDPLDVANEGKVVIAIREPRVQEALRLMRAHPLGEQSRCIGRVTEVNDGIAELLTHIGGRRMIHKPYGEQLPRIC